MELIKFEDVNNKIITVRDQQVILDSDVAALYGVETKDINRAVKNNPDKFPEGFIIETSKDEKDELVKNFHRFDKLKHSTVPPTAFTEQGLYMLATILKSSQATATTIAIIKAFTKVRELSRTFGELYENPEEEKQKSLMARSGTLLAELLDDGLKPAESEATIELNLAFLKLKKTVKRTK